MDKLLDLYLELIRKIEESGDVGAGLTTMFPMKGKKYNGSLMVVGRAVNGWDETKWFIYCSILLNIWIYFLITLKYLVRNT